MANKEVGTSDGNIHFKENEFCQQGQGMKEDPKSWHLNLKPLAEVFMNSTQGPLIHKTANKCLGH